MTKLMIGDALFSFLTGKGANSAFAMKLLNMNTIPVAAKINYIEAEVENGKLKFTYLQDSRKSDTPFSSPLRQHAKPITVLKKLLPEADLPVLNSWIDVIKAHFALPEHTVKQVSGADILPMYHEENYVKAGGSTLGQSCMRYNKSQPFIEFYARNINVSGVYVDINDRVAARALVWRAIHERKVVTVLDRIYAISDVIGSILKSWSETHCDYTLDHTTKLFCNNKTGERNYLDLYVPLNYINSPYPYLDNFKILMGHRLYNIYQPKLQSKTLTDTSGSHGLHQLVSGYKPEYKWNVNTRKWVPKDDVLLLKDGYYLKTEVENCRICSLYVLRNTNKYRLNGEPIYICGAHTAPFTIDNITYDVCLDHAELYTDRCNICASRPKYCYICLSTTRNYLDTPRGAVCINCQVSITCGACNTECPRYEATRYSNHQYYCMPCYDAWERCPTCSDRIPPDITECPCAADRTDCVICGTNGWYDDMYSANESYYCGTCFNEHIFECHWCGTYVEVENRSAISEICQPCYNANAFECAHCNTTQMERTIVWSEQPTCQPCGRVLQIRCARCMGSFINNPGELNTICSRCPQN